MGASVFEEFKGKLRLIGADQSVEPLLEDEHADDRLAACGFLFQHCVGVVTFDTAIGIGKGGEELVRAFAEKAHRGGRSLTAFTANVNGKGLKFNSSTQPVMSRVVLISYEMPDRPMRDRLEKMVQEKGARVAAFVAITTHESGSTARNDSKRKLVAIFEPETQGG